MISFLTKAKKLLKVRWLKTIYFNFHYLPFKQAYKLPILLFNPILLKCKGRIVIDCKEIKTGMIQLGDYYIFIYPKSKFIWENKGGTVIFSEKCFIGNGSAISIGETGFVKFGNNFAASSNFRLVSNYCIQFAENVRVGWETLIMDSSLHSLKDQSGKKKGNSFDKIAIGKNNWIPTKCIVLKGTKTPDYCIFGSGSILKDDYSKNETHILMAGNPLVVKVSDVWRDMNDDSIVFEKATDIA